MSLNDVSAVPHLSCLLSLQFKLLTIFIFSYFEEILYLSNYHLHTNVTQEKEEKQCNI
jgi:hypothetical protein